MEYRYEGPAFSFLGGAAPLDFCNTVDWHSSETPQDRLRGYKDFVAWAVAAGVVSEDEGEACFATARGRDREADEAFRKAIQIRETLFRIFSAAAHREAPNELDVARLDEAWRETSARLAFAYGEGGFEWRWTFGDEPDLLRPLYRIVRAAVELLVTPRAAEVRRCEGPPGCGWLFLDRTKNRSRRWCSMSDCGNREKTRRYYQRRRENGKKDG